MVAPTSWTEPRRLSRAPMCWIASMRRVQTDGARCAPVASVPSASRRTHSRATARSCWVKLPPVRRVSSTTPAGVPGTVSTRLRWSWFSPRRWSRRRRANAAHCPDEVDAPVGRPRRHPYRAPRHHPRRRPCRPPRACASTALWRPSAMRGPHLMSGVGPRLRSQKPRQHPPVHRLHMNSAPPMPISTSPIEKILARGSGRGSTKLSPRSEDSLRPGEDRVAEVRWARRRFA